MLSTCSLHWLARPHVLGWLFLMAAVWYAERHAGRDGRAFGWRDAALIAAFTALWANIHASFFLAPLVALIYAAGAAARCALWDSPDAARPAWYLRAAAIAAAAGLANPYGWGLYRHVFDYLRDSELLGRIGEFQSFDFHAGGSGQILAALLIGMCGGVLALGRRRPEHLALAAMFTVLGLRSARGLPLAALVLLPIANGAITEALAGAAAASTGDAAAAWKRFWLTRAGCGHGTADFAGWRWLPWPCACAGESCARRPSAQPPASLRTGSRWRRIPTFPKARGCSPPTTSAGT